MRMFMFIVVTYEMKMDEFDVRAAYLHSYLTETIYMKPPHGAERYDENGNELIWLLVKSLYGLRQSGHNWMVDFFSFLEGYGMSRSPADTSLWFLHKNGVPIIALFVHTDDGKIAYSDHLERDRFMDALRKRFDIGSRRGADSPECST
ncbi:reverse transcriptase Ty1/copia-type domain-containing protein [Pseudoscourfieldia marina]